MPDMWVCGRNPAVNKWNKPERPARWTAGLKAEKAEQGASVNTI